MLETITTSAENGAQLVRKIIKNKQTEKGIVSGEKCPVRKIYYIRSAKNFCMLGR